MSEFAIEAEGLGKRYLLGETKPWRQAARALMPWRGVDDATRKSSEFWALNDVSFKIKRGEAVGIIGHNGAGKSTLLKILSRITPPTRGSAVVRGRVGTLLEVGTGFQPELSGRENIFLSGILLGMQHSEVVARFDDIVEFAGVAEFIDTPVKRYSSGMYVRLAFAVASYLDPDILILDEVLAVGDAAFQKRSLERLESDREREGRTILFVSHNLSAIRNFCQRAIVLDHGRMVFDGGASEGIQMYLRRTSSGQRLGDLNLKDRLNRTSGAVRFYQVGCVDGSGAETWTVETGQRVTLSFSYRCHQPVSSLYFHFSFRSTLNSQIINVLWEPLSADIKPGESREVRLSFPELPLRPGDYQLYVGLCDDIARIFYDVIDQNVSLPFLAVEQSVPDRLRRDAIVDIPYTFERRPASAEGGDPAEAAEQPAGA